LGNCIGRGQFGAVYKGLNMETGMDLLLIIKKNERKKNQAVK